MDMNGVQQQEAGLGEAATSHNAAISFVELPSLISKVKKLLLQLELMELDMQ